MREATGGEDGIRTHETLMRSTPLAGERLRPLGHLSGKGEIAGTLCHFKRIARLLAKFPANYRTLYMRDQASAWNQWLSSGGCGAVLRAYKKERFALILANVAAHDDSLTYSSPGRREVVDSLTWSGAEAKKRVFSSVKTR